MSSRGVKRSHSKSPANRGRSQSPKKWKKPERRGNDRNSVRIYVSNLPYELKWQELKDLFKEKVGNDVTYAQLYEEFDGKPSGAGIVEVKNRDSATKAIEQLDRHEIKGRKIIVREERDKDRMRHSRDSNGPGFEGGFGGGNDGRNMMGGGPNMLPDVGSGYRGFTVEWMNHLGIDVSQITNQVFVANLDYKVTKSKLTEIFKMAGNVIEVDIKLDKAGKSRGLGIVRFEHPIEAVQAISLFTNQYLFERQIHVRMDRWVEPIMQDIPPRLPSGLKSIGIGLGSQGQPLLNIGEIANTLTLSMLMGQTNAQQMNMNNGNNNMMNIPTQPSNNLSAGIMGNVANLSNLVNPAAAAVGLGGLGQAAGLPNQLMGQPAVNQGMMNQTAQALLNSLGLNALVQQTGGLDFGGNLNAGGLMGLGGGTGNVGAPVNLGTNDVGSSLMNQNMSFNTGQNAGYDSRDHSHMSSFNRGGPGGDRGFAGEVSTIFVKNLPYSFSNSNLYDKFRDYGEIKFAEIKMDANGRSRGYGVVQYYNAECARKAICLVNGSRIDGRQIEVRLKLD